MRRDAAAWVLGGIGFITGVAFLDHSGVKAATDSDALVFLLFASIPAALGVFLASFIPPEKK